MGKLAELDNDTLNRVKIDSNKFDTALGADCNFLDMFDKGLVTITGEKDGEFIYGITDQGRATVEAYEKKNGKPKLSQKNRKALKRHQEQKNV